MESKIYGYIYLVTNKINGKQYVGQTVQTIKDRFGGHCSKIKPVISKAIKKYGKENFIIKEIAVAYTQEQLTFSEGFYIHSFNTLAPNGYNIKKIIDGKGKHPEETIEKIRTKANTPERLKLSREIGKRNRNNIYKNSSSKYIGVCIKDFKYTSKIFFKINIHIGTYNSEIEAAKAYDIAAIKYLGNEATLNFPELRQDYINGKIIINKNTKQTSSKSGIEGVWFHKHSNRWRVKYFDTILKKNREKFFKTIEDANFFKNKLLN